VIAEATGANVVSTAPTTIEGGLQAVASVVVDGRTRSAIDPDRYTGGFATWTGTSFAAPILAGHFLARLAEQSAAPDRAAREKLIRGLCRPKLAESTPGDH